MKNYKFLVPVILIGMFAMSVYTLYDTKASALEQYNEYLSAARSYRSQDISVDAEEYYEKALDINPSLELYVEIGEFYIETGETRTAIKWGKEIIELYPKESGSYEFLMSIYNEQEDYAACFDLADTMESLEVSSSVCDEILSSMEYEFFLNGEFADVGVFSGGLCPVMIGEKWGYVDTSGSQTVSCQYVEVGYYSSSIAPVLDSDGNAYFIDESGNKKKTLQTLSDVEHLGFMENGIFSAFIDGVWNFYNDSEEFLFGGYETASVIGNGVVAAMDGSNWILLDSSGQDLTGATYDDVVMDEKSIVYRNERIFVCQDDEYYMIDSSGNIFGDRYEDACVFNDSTYAAVQIDGQWGFVDKDGNIVIEAQYDDARSFSNGFAAVKIDGQWGFIDLDGNVVIEPQFDDAKDFTSAGSVFVLNEESWELLRLYKYNH